MSDMARSLRLFVSRHLSPEARSAQLAAFARADVARLQQEGRAPLAYETIVDGRPGAPPEAVRPEGTIIYHFNGLREAVAFCLTYLVARSPVLTGRYRNAWHVLVDGRPWAGPLEAIPAQADIIIVNVSDYARKIDVGSQGAGAIGAEVISAQGKRAIKRGIHVSSIEACRIEAVRRWPALRAARVFVELPQGPAPAPYTLKGGVVSGHIAAPAGLRRRLKVRYAAFKPRYSNAGEQMTYPALALSWAGARG